MFLPLLFLEQNCALSEKMIMEQLILWLSGTGLGT